MNDFNYLTQIKRSDIKNDIHSNIKNDIQNDIQKDIQNRIQSNMKIIIYEIFSITYTMGRGECLQNRFI